MSESLIVPEVIVSKTKPLTQAEKARLVKEEEARLKAETEALAVIEHVEKASEAQKTIDEKTAHEKRQKAIRSAMGDFASAYGKLRDNCLLIVLPCFGYPETLALDYQLNGVDGSDVVEVIDTWKTVSLRSKGNKDQWSNLLSLLKEAHPKTPLLLQKCQARDQFKTGTPARIAAQAEIDVLGKAINAAVAMSASALINHGKEFLGIKDERAAHQNGDVFDSINTLIANLQKKFMSDDAPASTASIARAYIEAIEVTARKRGDLVKFPALKNFTATPTTKAGPIDKSHEKSGEVLILTGEAAQSAMDMGKEAKLALAGK